MTPDDETIAREATPAAGGVLISLCAILVVLLPVLLGAQPGWEAPIAVLLLVAVVALSVFSVLLYRRGTAIRLSPAAWATVAFIVGGVSFDVFATVIHSPDLAEETNPVARMLLDAQYDVPIVYAYGALLQLLVMFNMSVFCLAFFRHRPTFTNSCFRLAGGSFPGFLKAAAGGGHQKWRQFLVPFQFSGTSWYHVVWVLAPVMLAGAAYRWYLGFQWFGVLSWLDKYVEVCTSVVFFLSLYVLWLRREFRRVSKEVAKAAQPSPI